jgi:hypothetical protein
MQLRTNGEMSVLAAIANLISDQLANMLIFMSDWAGNLQDVDVHLNTDYTPIGMSAQELTALVQAWQAGAISNNVLFDNLKRGEIISDDADFEEEQQNIADGAMNLADSE